MSKQPLHLLHLWLRLQRKKAMKGHKSNAGQKSPSHLWLQPQLSNHQMTPQWQSELLAAGKVIQVWGVTTGTGLQRDHRAAKICCTLVTLFKLPFSSCCGSEPAPCFPCTNPKGGGTHCSTLAACHGHHNGRTQNDRWQMRGVKGGWRACRKMKYEKSLYHNFAQGRNTFRTERSTSFLRLRLCLFSLRNQLLCWHCTSLPAEAVGVLRMLK